MTQLIAGILRLDGAPAEESTVRRMLAAMNPRGLPSAVRVAARGRIAMGALRLGLAGAAKPAAPGLVDADAALLAADVSIHARDRIDLPGQGAGTPDVEVLHAVWAARGAAGLGTVHGDFAFAAFIDGRLTLGRDHFGARPLLYAERAGELIAFASMPSALLRTGLAPWDIDEEVGATWPVQPSPPPGRTIFRRIRAVPAAHVVDFGEGRGKPGRYWRLDARRRLPFDSDPREIARETARLLAQAVERRLPASGPGAGHLSGGLDSSPVAVLAARALARQGRRFFGYTFREPDDGPGLPGEGDAPVAAMVAAYEPAITQVTIPAPCLLSAYAEGIEPDSMLPVSPLEPEEQILRDAAGRGAPVILSGWGGDQILSYQGRGAQADLLRAGRLIRLWRHLREETRETGVGLARLILSAVVMRALPQTLRDALRWAAGRDNPYRIVPRARSRLVAPGYRGRLLENRWPDDGDTHRIRRDLTEAWYIQTRLEAFARQGARHGIAYAYPLLDLDLAEYALMVPGIFLRRGAGRRLLIRSAAEGILPDEVRLMRPKLRPYPGEDLRIAAEREHLLDILRQWGKNDRIRGFLDLDVMAEVVQSAGSEAAESDSLIDLTPAFQFAGMLAALEGGAE